MVENIVIIGLSFGGIGAFEQLHKKIPKEKYRIVIIHALEYAYYPISSLRAVTEEGWQESTTISISEVLKPGSPHILLSQTRATRLSDKSVTISPPHPTLGSTIPYSHLIYSTGSAYPFPCKTDIPTIASIQATTTNLLRSVQKATKLLVVGGGASGIEFAGEVSELYPDKEITLVHPRGRFCDDKVWNPKLGDSLEKQLRKRGVKILFNVRVNVPYQSGLLETMTNIKLTHSLEVNADFVFIAHGSTPNSSVLAEFDASVTNDLKRVRVNNHLQVLSISHEHDFHSNIYAPGDVNDIPENKLAGAAYCQGAVAGRNILKSINGNTALEKYKPWPGKCMITIGHTGGAGQLAGFYIAPWAVRWAMKGLGVERARKIFKTHG